MLEKSRICYVQIKHIFAWAYSTYFCAFHLSGEDDLSATEMYERPLSVITNPLGLWRVRVYCMSICVLMVFRRIYLCSQEGIWCLFAFMMKAAGYIGIAYRLNRTWKGYSSELYIVVSTLAIVCMCSLSGDLLSINRNVFDFLFTLI